MTAMKDQELSPTQVIQLSRAMLSVALVDDIHPAEAALIGQFYETSRSADMPTTAALLAQAATQPFQTAEMTGTPAELADTVVLMCLMTAYADGQFSEAERALVLSISSAMGVGTARFDELLARVRDELVGAISHLPDAGSVAVVVRELSAAD